MSWHSLTPDQAPICQLFSDIEVGGAKATIRYFFDPPIPGGTRIRMTAESESPGFTVRIVDSVESVRPADKQEK